jgi:tellurite resistance protein
MTASLTIHEALIWIMVTTALADRSASDGELDQVDQLIRRLPVFEGFTAAVPAIVERCAGHLRDRDGLDVILDQVTEALPQRLHETAYALAVEVAASDLEARQEELVFLQLLEDRLELPKLAVAAIEHSARVRFRRG